MKYARVFYLVLACCLLAAPAVAQQIGGGNCSAASLSGTYSLTMSGRGISAAGSLAGTYQADGTATFDGVSAVVLSGTVNTAQAAGAPFSYAGNYAIASNCSGTITFVTGSTASFTLVVWGSGADFNIIGADSNYVYSGSGGNVWPAGCANATLSGAFSFSASGTTLSGTTQTGSADEAGVLQFDGQGNVTANYTDSSGGTTPVPLKATGTYSVTSSSTTAACLATASLVDSNGKTNTLNFALTGAYGGSADLLLASPQFVRDGSAHAAYLNPTESITNVFSYVPNWTPPGSAFAIFGTNLAAKDASAATVPFPATLGSTKVTVNGEAVPLYYVSADQINAQMPWEVPAGSVASVVVLNGSATSNTAAVYVPATGTPGIDIYNTNRAVVTNADGTVNSASNPANVGDEVVAWFTGGGPVDASGKLVTGSPAPGGLSWITGDYTIMVGTVQATTIQYIGLTPGSIGLYQANFTVPQLAKGSYNVQITIAGQASNKVLMSVK
jgi:uncharacterized protein (TIGR03437 family)